MASTIITKNSSTASAVPVVGDLTKGELAVNVTDKKIYTKDNSAAVVKLVGSLGNQEANAVAITGGSIAGITDLAVADGGTGASTASDARTNLGLGTIATQAASSVTITGGSVTGITDITVADGGTGASTAANARSNLGAAASGANSDITSLSGLTTALSVAQGGTGITSFGSGVATFLGTPSSANLLAAVTDETGTGALVFANTPTLVAPILGTPTSGNFSTGTFTWPTFNQNTTGTAAGLSATLAITSGGTGATTAGGALTSLGAYAASNPSGYTSNTGTVTSVGGTGTVNGLTLTGTVTTSGNLTLGGTLSGVSLTSQVSGTLPTANGGTNLTSFTSSGVVYASSTSALATGSALTFDGTTVLSNETGSGVYQSRDNATFRAYAGGTNLTVVDINSAGTVGITKFSINNTEALRLTSTSLYTASGINVGFGTSSPTQKLHVQSASNAQGLFKTTGAGGGSNRSSVILESPSNTWYINTNGSDLNGSDGALGFYGNSATRMVIDTSGNLLVGTTANGNSARLKSKVSGGSVGFEVTDEASSDFLIIPASSAGVCKIGPTTGAMAFQTAGTERARIDSSGNLLVGKTSPADTVVGSMIRGSGYITSTWADSTDATTTYHAYSTGASAYRFYVGLGGTIFATSIVITAISDQRLKENVRDIDTGLNSIMALKPRRFDWKEGKGQDKKNVAGFIAQEFETVFPECVGVSKAGEDGIEYKNINHETLIPTLVKAMQEQQAIIESLKARLDAANL